MDYFFGRYSLVLYSGLGSASFAVLGLIETAFFFASGFLAILCAVGIHDFSQKKRAVLGNYPLLGRFRFFFESIRPELRQYFWES